MILRDHFEDIIEDRDGYPAWTTVCKEHAEELALDENRLSICSVPTLCDVKDCIHGSYYYYDFTKEELSL